MSYNMEDFLLGGFIVLIIVIVVIAVSPPIHRMQVEADIKGFVATQQVVEEMRFVDEDVENVAAIHDITAQNRWLAAMQYWNGTIVDLWIPDKVMELKPIGVNKHRSGKVTDNVGSN